MASYYQGSYLTIAAGASADCHGGFCRDLDQSPLFRVFAPGNSSRRIAVRETAARENSLRYPEDKKIPLLRRGWVLQEQVPEPSSAPTPISSGSAIACSHLKTAPFTCPVFTA